MRINRGQWRSQCVCWLTVALLCLHSPLATDIGDGRSSEGSSREYFSGMDADADGVVERDEMVSHIQMFGGNSLDEPEEIQRCVENAFSRVDTNHDGELSAAESKNYWRKIGTMLSVQEVADWVVHGIQLPPEVGHTFRENSVSGYDFAELIEDDGKVLIEELGITKIAHRKKLVRSMSMVMSGMSVKPDDPQRFSAEDAGCGSVVLRWGTPDGKGFPVHKFRVLRRVVRHRTQTRKELTLRQSVPVNHSPAILPPPVKGDGAWLLMYEGVETEFEDESLEDDFVYEYRVEAWNLFGRGSAQLVYGEQERSKTCHSESVWIRRAGTVLWVCSTVTWVLYNHLSLSILVLTVAWRLLVLAAGLKKGTDGTSSLFVWLYSVLGKLPGSQHVLPHLPDPNSTDDSMIRRDGTVSPTAVGTRRFHVKTPPARKCSTKKCFVCNRNFTWRRLRHGCNKCHRPFCAADGRVTHKISSCGPSSGCLCNDCLGDQIFTQVPPSKPASSTDEDRPLTLLDVKSESSGDGARPPLRRFSSENDFQGKISAGEAKIKPAEHDATHRRGQSASMTPAERRKSFRSSVSLDEGPASRLRLFRRSRKPSLDLMTAEEVDS